MEFSVVIPAYEEEENIGPVVRGVCRVLESLGREWEVIVVDGGSKDRTREFAAEEGARVVLQTSPGYGGALKEGFRAARGRYVITMDSDLSHDPEFIRGLAGRRQDAELVVASRYVPGGRSETGLYRKVLSLVLNNVFRGVLDLPFRDISSGFRLYYKPALDELSIESRDFDVLEELLIEVFANGWRVLEMPFQYKPRAMGRSHVRLIKFGISYSRTLYRMWKLRNSIFSADYDSRGFDSVIPLQRYWHRTRYKIIMGFLESGGRKLDIGCGSGRVIESLSGAIGLDISLKKLRYLRERHVLLVNADIARLPFLDRTMDQVICSEVIEHVPPGREMFAEMWRVLRRGGVLVVGTPDYARPSWRFLEWLYRKVAPGGYGEKHITRYTRESLESILRESGFEVLGRKYVGYSELIVKARKMSLERAPGQDIT